MPRPRDPYWMTVAEAAKKFKVSKTIIYRWIHQNRVHHTKRYGIRVIKRDQDRPTDLEYGQAAWRSPVDKRKPKNHPSNKLKKKASPVDKILHAGK